MKHIPFVGFSRATACLAGLAAVAGVSAQSDARPSLFAPAWSLMMHADPVPAVPDNDAFSEEELDDLLGPVALYPDVLLSAVLGASVYPDQVFAAAAFVAGGGTAAQIEAKDWEDPVKAVAQVPEVIAMMGQYPDWTRAIGTAFLTQAWDVMQSIQRLRSIAFDNGVLETTPQQVVTVQQETQKIVIMPADPTIIFVPQYNPSVVFVRDNRAVARAGWIGFGTGIVVGAIIWGGSCNWSGGFIGWGRGWGWGGWSNTRVNNNINVNVNNNNINNINVNRPGSRPPIDRPGGRPGSGNANNRPDLSRPDINRPGTERPGGVGGGGRPEINRPGTDRPGVNRPEINRPGTDRPGITRPGERPPNQRPNIDRPGTGNISGINRPGTRDRIGQEGARWQPDANRVNRPGTTPGSRPTDWRNNASRPDARPGSSVGNRASPGGNRPTEISRPNTPTSPGVNRPSSPPASRPAQRPATRAPNVQPAPGAVARPQNPAALPSAGAGTGNRPSGFSGGPSNAAAARGAASRGGR